MHLDAGWREYAKGYAKGAYQRASNYWRGSQPQPPPPDTQAETPPEPEMQAVEHAVDGNSARIDDLEPNVNALNENQEELRQRLKTLERVLQEQGREFAQIWEAIRRN